MPQDSRTLRPTSRCLPRLTIPSLLPRSPPSAFSGSLNMDCYVYTKDRFVYTEDRYVYPSPPCSPFPFSCHLRFVMSTSEIAISPPKTAQDAFRFRQRPPYDDFLLLRSGFRFSYRSLLHWLAIIALRPLASTLLTLRRVVNPASSNLIQRQLSFSKFYKPRTGRLPPSTN